MTRFLLVALGYVMLAGAFVSLVVDGTRSIASSAVAATSLRAALDKAWPALVPAMRGAVSQLSPALWDPVAVSVLAVPLALALAVPGVLLVAALRRREPEIGFDTRA